MREVELPFEDACRFDKACGSFLGGGGFEVHHLKMTLGLFNNSNEKRILMEKMVTDVCGT